MQEGKKMAQQLFIEKAFLMEALATLGGSSNPNPDDPGDPDNPFGPYGPGGPVLKDALKARYSRYLTRQFIQAVIIAAQVLAIQEGREKSDARAIRSAVSEFADEFCGTGWPHRIPGPRPWWWRDFDPGEPRPIDYLIASVEFYEAAKSVQNADLKAAFEQASDQLVEFSIKTSANVRTLAG
jgi:hypothetical protein